MPGATLSGGDQLQSTSRRRRSMELGEGGGHLFKRECLLIFRREATSTYYFVRVCVCSSVYVQNVSFGNLFYRKRDTIVCSRRKTITEIQRI